MPPSTRVPNQRYVQAVHILKLYKYFLFIMAKNILYSTDKSS